MASPHILVQEHRASTHARLSSELAFLSDEALLRVLQNSEPEKQSIGGKSALLTVDNHRIFVKKIPLSNLERTSEHYRATANVYELPLFYQYRIGSTGFGAWRELAAHELTTRWVLSEQCASFPILYHWRVIEHGASQGISATEDAEVDGMVKFWGDSKEIRGRLDHIKQSTAEIVLFLEPIPVNLPEWLSTRLDIDDSHAHLAISTLEQNFKEVFDFTGEKGFVHFDPHFDNVLTHESGDLFLCDFGLALSHTFDLTFHEIEFLELHRNYDRCVAITSLVHALVAKTLGRDHWERRLRDFLSTNSNPELNDRPAIASAIRRLAPVAITMTEFYRELQQSLNDTRYPASKLQEFLNTIDGV